MSDPELVEVLAKALLGPGVAFMNAAAKVAYCELL